MHLLLVFSYRLLFLNIIHAIMLFFLSLRLPLNLLLFFLSLYFSLFVLNKGLLDKWRECFIMRHVVDRTLEKERKV